jgi:Ca-activated chloride channel family protein
MTNSGREPPMRRGLSEAGEHSAARAMALPVLLWSVLVCSAGDQLPTAGQDHNSESFRLSVDVALVVLHASVTDRGGGFIHNLGDQDFDVYEDGVRQHIRLFKHEDVPVTVGLVVDHSSTMRRKLPEVAAAAQIFVRSSNPEDEMFVVNFNERVSLGLPRPVRFTNNPNELESAITSAPAGGETALYDAIAKALEELRAANRDRKVLIIISDGGDNASARSLTQVRRLAGQSDAVIYTVGIFDEEDPDRNPTALKSLARATGGVAFFPKQVSEVVAVCERIARDVRHQYTIGYVPSNASRDGTYRTIRVLATGKGHENLFVRTRTSYIAAGERRIDKRSAK